MADEYKKMSSDTLDYIFDWQEWLTAHAGGDQIDESEFSIHPDDEELDIESIEPTNTPMTSTVWASGGVIGQTYKVFNKITTVGGRVYSRWMLLRILEVE